MSDEKKEAFIYDVLLVLKGQLASEYGALITGLYPQPNYNIESTVLADIVSTSAMFS